MVSVMSCCLYPVIIWVTFFSKINKWNTTEIMCFKAPFYYNFLKVFISHILNQNELILQVVKSVVWDGKKTV